DSGDGGEVITSGLLGWGAHVSELGWVDFDFPGVDFDFLELTFVDHGL
nr:hypothetical protein [Tanacetum cinerariifolium]